MQPPVFFLVVWLCRRMGVLGKVSSTDLPAMRKLVHYYKQNNCFERNSTVCYTTTY